MPDLQNTLNSNRPQVTFGDYRDDDDDEGPIWETGFISRVDKKFIALRSLEAKLDRLRSEGNETPVRVRLMSCLEFLIKETEYEYRKEMKHAETDIGRKRLEHDRWRAEEGREDYNERRRQVRGKPNVSLKGMTEEQKKQRLKDQKADHKWLKTNRPKYQTEQMLMAAFATHIQKRAAKRGIATANYNPDTIH